MAKFSDLNIDFAAILPAKVLSLLQNKGITAAKINSLLGDVKNMINFTQIADEAFDALSDATNGGRCVFGYG